MFRELVECKMRKCCLAGYRNKKRHERSNSVLEYDKEDYSKVRNLFGNETNTNITAKSPTILRPSTDDRPRLHLYSITTQQYTPTLQ